MKEDLSVEAMSGYILHELKVRGPCVQQYFTEGGTPEDIDLAIKALSLLQKDDTILRKGSVFYLPGRYQVMNDGVPIEGGLL